MTREQLTQYISDPHALLQLNYEELKSLVMQFPYSTNLRLLLYEKSALENHKDAERHLQMVATYTTDRKRLYTLVQSLQPIKVKQTESEVLELAALSSIEKMRNQRDALKIETSLNAIEEKKSLVLPLIEEVSMNNLMDRKKELEISTPLINTEETVHKFNLEALNQINLEQQKNETENVEHKAEVPISNLPENSVTEVKKPVIDLEITNTSVKELDATHVAFNNLSAQEKISFSEWLSQFRTFSKLQNQQEATSNAPIANEAEEQKPLVENSHLEQHIETAKYEVEPVKKEEKILNEDLIAQMFGEANSVSDSLFLPTSPRNDLGIAALLNDETEETELDEASDVIISEKTSAPKEKKKREMHSLAAKSIAADDDIASETLADLLVMQGNHKKAISMYKRLGLQNPDKIHYFAEKIRELMNE